MVNKINILCITPVVERGAMWHWFFISLNLFPHDGDSVLLSSQ